MKNVRSLLFSFAAITLSLAPLLVSAQSFLVPRSPDASGKTDYAFYNLCKFGELIQNIINFAIVLAVPMVAILVAYAGFLYFTSGANPGNVAKAKQIFGTALIGFLVAISGWLLVNTVLHALMGGNGYFPNNSWFTIQCSGERVLNTSVSQFFSSIPNTPPPTGGLTTVTDPTGGPTFGPSSVCNNGYSLQQSDTEYWCQSTDPTTPDAWQPANYYLTGPDYNTPYNGDIAAAANAYKDTPTNAGPDGGNLACAWAVNNVLQNAGIDPIDADSVSSMEQELRNGRGTQVDRLTAQAGDIVIFGGMSHVGICQNEGCTQVISNSSSLATFSSVYAPTTGSRFYRVNR